MFIALPSLRGTPKQYRIYFNSKIIGMRNKSFWHYHSTLQNYKKMASIFIPIQKQDQDFEVILKN